MNEGDAAIAAARALIARDEKIERLEAELADEKAKKKAHAIEVRRLREKVTALLAELADWQRHGVRVTEDCETCEGSGGKPCDASIHKLDKDGIESHPCPDCDGTGKKLRDGVELDFEPPFPPSFQRVSFPAELMAASDE